MNHEADKQVEIGNKVDEQRHVDEDQERSLNRGPFAKHGKEEKEYSDQSLNEDSNVRRSPARMDAAEGFRKVSIKANDKCYSRRADKPCTYPADSRRSQQQSQDGDHPPTIRTGA